MQIRFLLLNHYEYLIGVS